MSARTLECMPPTPTPTTPRKVRSARPATGPWFSRRPTLALVVIGVLYLAVFTLRVLPGTPVDAYSMLYVLPDALAATAFGRHAGVAAALLAVLLIVTWTVVKDVALGPPAWATRVIPILLLGYLPRLGHGPGPPRRG